MSTANLTAVAYHEAGHAFAAMRLGYPVASVSIVATDDESGSVSSEWFNPQLCERFHLAVIAEAGVAAEFIAQQMGGHDANLQQTADGAHGDFRLLESIQIGGLRSDDAFERATELLIESWNAVEAIADLLLKRGKVDGAELRNVCYTECVTKRNNV